MKALQYDRYGDARVLRLGEVAEPWPGPGEVLVGVEAAALNPIDWKLRSGSLRWVYPLGFPVTPGFDVAGTIREVGPRVGDFAVGDRVCAMSDQRAGGTFAEAVVCGARALARIPGGVDMAKAAALPLAGLTALQGLRDHVGLRAGDRVLVVGATGGVGHFAVPLASALGGKVTAICGAKNREWVSALGAEAVFDYRDPNWTKAAGRFDRVFDTVGTLGLGGVLRLLKHGGRYATTLPGPGALIKRLAAPLFRRRVRSYLAKPSGADLARLLDLHARGELPVTIDQSHHFEDYPAAFTHSESGHARGKIVLRFGETS